MAAPPEAMPLECKWCGTQYETGKESEEAGFGDFTCKENKRPGQEKYHPGVWNVVHQGRAARLKQEDHARLRARGGQTTAVVGKFRWKCCRSSNRSNPGCQTRTIQVNGPHEPTPASAASVAQIAAVGTAEHARQKAAAQSAREQRGAAAKAEREQRETERRKAAARLELQDEFKVLSQQHQITLASERAQGGAPAAAAPTAAPAAGEVRLAAGVVPSGPFKGMDRAAALRSLNVAFQRDLARFVEEAAPASINLSSCMQEYVEVAAVIKGCG